MRWPGPSACEVTFPVMAQGVTITPDTLARLMPMHALLDPAGGVLSAGPTLMKLCGGRLTAGSRWTDHFAFLRPAFLPAHAKGAPVRLSLSLCEPPQTALRGLAVPLGGGAGWLLNLSLGIGAVAAARVHRLTNADFAPTDLTVELLYLTEANQAVTGELAALNGRLRTAHSLAERQSMTDALTGLGNRRAIDRVLARLLHEGVAAGQRAEEGGAAGRATAPGFALLHMDLDFFKTVNDRHGHAAGDAVLRHVARVLRDETRPVDFVARAGGDEFVMILRGLCEPAQVLLIAQRIIAGVERPVPHEGEACRVSASIGAVLSCACPGATSERLHAKADAALYAAKRAGRGRATLARAQKDEAP